MMFKIDPRPERIEICILAVDPERADLLVMISNLKTHLVSMIHTNFSVVRVIPCPARSVYVLSRSQTDHNAVEKYH